MSPYQLITFFTFFIYSLTSCTKPPDIKFINEDLGISLPEEHEVINADQDPFGLGADADMKYTFQFDSLSFNDLIKSIESSTLFNTASKKGFKILTTDKKINIIKILSQKKMTSYWIKSDSNYIFNGNELFLNDRDKCCQKASEENIYLPNHHKERTFQDGSPLIMYQVIAIVDRKKFTLYYNYVHT